MNETPRGPETYPLERFDDRPHWLVITVVDVVSKRKIREEKINFSDRNSRLWLSKITYWAITNKCALVTCAEEDFVVEKTD